MSAPDNMSNAVQDRPLNVLLLFPGPVHDAVDQFKDRLERMSERFTGTVLIPGAKDEVFKFGHFSVVMLQEGKAGAFGTVGFIRRAAAKGKQLANEERQRGRPYDLISSWDPLKGGLTAWAIAREHGTPLAVELNGDYAAHANFADIKNPVLRWGKRRGFIAVVRYVLARSQGIKLLLDPALDYFRGGLRGQVVRTFPDYLDLGPFKNLGDAPEILFAGFPFYRKGVDVLIDAFKKVSDDFPEWRLKILGWFPDKTLLNAAIDGHPRVIVHPPVYHRDVADHLGRCGIFALPSRSEGQPRVLIEAMSCGKPRVGTRVDGIPTVINDGEDGYLVPSGDSAALAEAFRKLMGDDAMRLRMGENASRRAREQFPTDLYVGRIDQFYRAVVASSRGVGQG